MTLNGLPKRHAIPSPLATWSEPDPDRVCVLGPTPIKSIGEDRTKMGKQLDDTLLERADRGGIHLARQMQ
jgi:hypothetical protein